VRPFRVPLPLAVLGALATAAAIPAVFLQSDLVPLLTRSAAVASLSAVATWTLSRLSSRSTGRIHS
jgi:hypothetical protein